LHLYGQNRVVVAGRVADQGRIARLREPAGKSQLAGHSGLCSLLLVVIVGHRASVAGPAGVTRLLGSAIAGSSSGRPEAGSRVQHQDRLGPRSAVTDIKSAPTTVIISALNTGRRLRGAVTTPGRRGWAGILAELAGDVGVVAVAEAEFDRAYLQAWGESADPRPARARRRGASRSYLTVSRPARP